MQFRKMARFAAAVALMVAAGVRGDAQTLINPVSQINWPLITGNGTPAATSTVCSATAVNGRSNAGQPYLDKSVTPNAYYICAVQSGTYVWQLTGVTGNITFLGTWSSGTTYLPNQAAFLASTGCTYVALQNPNPNLNQNPSTSPSFWAPFACGSGGGSAITGLTQDVVASGPGSAAATVRGVNGTPLCTGFTPTNGQALTLTTASSPNPCWTAAASASGVTLQTNGVNNSSQSTLNQQSSSADTVGLHVAVTNTSGGNVKAEISGGSYTGNSATASALQTAPTPCSGGQLAGGVDVHGNSINCASAGGSGPTLQTNGVNNSSQSTLNQQSSSADAVGLHITVTNVSGGNVKAEISGGSYSGNAATATGLLNSRLIGNLAANVLADYTFSDGSGSTLTDVSGANACSSSPCNGTLSGGLTSGWVQGGLHFTGGSAQNVSLPAGVNGAQTLVFATDWTPLTTVPCAINQSAAGVCPGSPTVYNTAYYAAYITASTGSPGVNIITSGPSGLGLGAPQFWNSSAVTASAVGTAGFHVWAFVLGSGGGNVDHIYLDGNEVSYLSQGATGTQGSGNLFIGSSGAGPWTNNAPDAIFYRLRMYSSQLSASDILQLTQAFYSDVATRGVQTAPLVFPQGAPELQCVGDSITAGVTLSAQKPFCSQLSLTNQPSYNVWNWGVAGSKLQQMHASEIARVGQLCSTNSLPSVVNILAGINDFNSGGTPAGVYADLQGEVQTLKRSGCKVFVSTLLDATGQDSNKNAYNALIRNGIVASGADAINDLAANPLAGADGAASNGTYFNGGLHPTDTLEPLLAAEMSNALNYYFGASANAPTITASTSYTMAAGDGYLTINPAGNTTVTLPDCLGQTGAVYKINFADGAGSHTLSIKNAVSAEPINGTDHSSSALTALTGQGTVSFRDIANPSASAGCHWDYSSF